MDFRKWSFTISMGGIWETGIKQHRLWHMELPALGGQILKSWLLSKSLTPAGTWAWTRNWEQWESCWPSWASGEFGRKIANGAIIHERSIKRANMWFHALVLDWNKISWGQSYEYSLLGSKRRYTPIYAESKNEKINGLWLGAGQPQSHGAWRDW